MEFEQAYNRLNDAQRAAVDHIDGPLLVIAGPGTGKTQLLSVRVANILKQTDVNPENILCLTFTETGASNMRHRLADFIGPEAYKVQIQTYHAFGSYILQEHRPDLKNAIDDLEQFTIIRDIQSSLHPRDMLRGDYQTKNIIGAISDIKGAAITTEDLQHIAKRNKIDQELILSAISGQINEIFNEKFNKKTSLPKYETLLESLKSFVDSAPEFIVGKIEPLSRIYYRSLAEILLKDDGKSPATELRRWKEKYFRKNAQNEWVFNILPIVRLESLANIMEQYQNRLQAAGMFDYSDMILTAIDLLKNDDEIRYNTQERFQYILLDEFQDTNDAQAQLVALLTDNPSNEGKPNIMAVGDDDQAIYGFQGANTSNFFDFDAKYHPDHIFLTKNYRSSAEILGLAHNVIEQGTDRFCKAPNVNIDKTITAENPPAQTAIELREFQTYQAEYSFVAKEIAKLIQQGVSGKKISVIAPKHKYLVSILPYLHSLGIKVAYTKRENIVDDPQIQTLLEFAELLTAVAKNPRDADPYWFRILSLPCWQIPADEVIAITQAARANKRSVIEELLASETDTHKAASTFVSELAAKIDSFSAEYIIAEISNRIYAEEDNYDYYSKLNTLRDMIISKDNHRSQKMRLAEFRDILRAYEAAEIQVLDKSPYHESDDAVILQTVHSSKGLEYEYVFLIAADNKNWSDAGGNRDRLSLPQNMEHIHQAGDSLDEKLRVFFVAITRAKAKLVMTYSLSNFAGQSADRLKFLDIREDADGNAISQVLPEKFAKVIPSDCEPLEPEDIAPDKWFDSYIPDTETKRNLLLPKVEHYRLSPTHLNSFIDLEYAGPAEFLKHYIIGVSSGSSAALNYGNYVHEIMDAVNKENISNDDAMAKFHKMVDEADAEKDEKDELHLRGDSELKQFLAERGDQIRDTHAESERGFFTENIMVGDIPLTGKIDRIEINDETKTITVADFKTGKAHDKWSTNDSTFKYKIQLYFYKFLLENSREYRNYKVTKGRLDWIAPNDFGETIALELDFKDAEAEQIKHLIKVVFRHIKTLDFPDTTAAEAAYNPTKAFFDQLIAEE